MNSIILIGDSIRMGYRQTVIDELSEVANFWSPSENGGDSRNVLDHLDDWVLSRNADILHLNCGLHDIKRNTETRSLQVPLDSYQQNLQQIIKQVQTQTDTRILWTNTTPVIEARHQKVKDFIRLNADIDAYNQAAREVMRAAAVVVNDMNAFVKDIGPERIQTADGVHYTEAGYHVIGKTIAAFIGSELD